MVPRWVTADHRQPCLCPQPKKTFRKHGMWYSSATAVRTSSYFRHRTYSTPPPPMCCRHGKQRIRQRKCQEEEGEEGLRLFCADEATRKQQNDCKSPPGSRHPLQKQASDTICSRHPEVQNVRQSSRTKRIKKTRKRRRRLSTSAGSHAGKVLP